MTQSQEPVDIFERDDFTASPAEPAASGSGRPAGSTARPRRLWLFALVGVAIGLVISWVIFSQGSQPQLPADHPATDAPIATPTPLTPDEMAQLKANVDADPTSHENRLIYGVALYNDGQFALAEEQWLEATRLDPSDPGPWYNLGFLYLSLDPPEAGKAEAAWRQVVDLVPGTSMAQTVSEHLDRLDTTPAPASPSPTPGG